MNIVEDLLIILSGYSRGYKLMRRRLHGYTGPADFSRIKQNLDAKENTLRVTLSRLKKRGFVENDDRIWSITERGKLYLKKVFDRGAPYKFLRVPHSCRTTLKNKKPRNIIIAFDIPELHRKKRDWLRIELVILGFIPLQKSVWLGPGPLQEDFIKVLGELNILKYLKFFHASEYEIV